MKNYSRLFATIILFGLISCGGKTSISTTDSFEQVNLPDGSVVSLNKNSLLSFEESFKDRTVQLKGEAMFDVLAGDGEFTVITETGEVVVLGTIFNVKDNGEEMEVEVEEGEVNIKSEGKENKLKRGDRATVKRGNEIKSAKANYQYKVWLNSLKKDFKEVGKEFKNVSRDVAKGSKEVGKDVSKESKKLGKGLKEVVKDAEKKIKD